MCADRTANHGLSLLGIVILLSLMIPNTGVAQPSALEQLKLPRHTGACGRWCVGDPINVGGGNLYEEYTDYQSGGAFPLVFFRAYNSGIAGANPDPHGDGGFENLGHGWTTNVDQNLFIVMLPLPPGATMPGPCIINGVAYFCPPADPTSNRPYQIDVTLWNADGSQEGFLYQGTGAPRIGAAFKNDPLTAGELRVASVSAENVITTYLYVRDDGTKELYGSTGKLLSVTDQNGLRQTYHYNARGNLTHVIGPFGRSMALAYDSRGRVKTLTNPAGGVISYQYNTIGNLVAVVYPDKSKLRYMYENRALPHALTSIIDQDGNRYVMWSYDKKGRAVTSDLADGTDHVRVRYNADGSADIFEPGGPTRQLTFKTIDYKEQMATTSAPCDSCNIKSITYDKNGFISSETDFRGHVTNFKNSSTGLELSRTENVGTKNQHSVSTQWNESFRTPTIMKTRQSTLRFRYDRNGRLLSMGGIDKTTHTFHQVQYKYNPHGLLLSETDPTGAVTQYSYDAQGNLATVTNPQGGVLQMPRYDANGYPLAIISPTGVKTDLTYDAMQRLVLRTVAGIKIEYHYDRVGQLKKVSAPNGAYIEYNYDISHRLISMNDNLGDTVEYKMDARGRVIGEHVYNKREGTLTPTQIINQLNTVLNT